MGEKRPSYYRVPSHDILEKTELETVGGLEVTAGWDWEGATTKGTVLGSLGGDITVLCPDCASGYIDGIAQPPKVSFIVNNVIPLRKGGVDMERRGGHWHSDHLCLTF